MLLVHGLCEHSGRYQALTRHLCEAGFAVSAFDLRGHGKSSGRRGATRFAATFDDLDRLVERHRDAGPLFLYGHSLGGLLVLAYGLERRPTIRGAVVSAPALHTSLREQRLKVLVTTLLGRVAPSASVPAGLDASLLSRDPEVVAGYLADPLVHRRITLGLGRDSLGFIDRLLRDPAGFPVPLLLLHGAADRVNYPSGSQAIASRLGEACTLRIYDGILHQPHTDPDSDRVFADVTAWLDRQLAAPDAAASSDR